MQWGAQRPIHFPLLMPVQANVLVSPLAWIVKGNKVANQAAIPLTCLLHKLVSPAACVL